jgi:hypothetical protein
MPPSGFNKKAIDGLLQFLEGCYEDLQAKIAKTPGRPSDVHAAIEEELSEIRDALKGFSLKKGVSPPRPAS